MPGRSLPSPLLGTAIVSAALALLAIPLHRLTSHATPPPQDVPLAGDSAATRKTRAILRIRTLDALGPLSLETPDGILLHRSDESGPGETEADVDIPLDEYSIDIRVRVKAGPEPTALFITLLPDGLEERTAYTIGSGLLDETLRFHWPHDHE